MEKIWQSNMDHSKFNHNYYSIFILSYSKWFMIFFLTWRSETLLYQFFFIIHWCCEYSDESIIFRSFLFIVLKSSNLILASLEEFIQNWNNHSDKIIHYRSYVVDDISRHDSHHWLSCSGKSQINNLNMCSLILTEKRKNLMCIIEIQNFRIYIRPRL